MSRNGHSDLMEPTPPIAPTELAVSGMTCNNCARHVREAIEGVPQVAGASVELEAGRVSVRWRGAANVPAVLRAVADAGYEAKPVDNLPAGEKERKRWSPLAGWQFNVVVGLACTVPLMAGDWMGFGMTRWFAWVSFALALPVQIFCGARFYDGAWRQLKSGSSNMDTLVALGSTTAFGYSVWALLSGAPGHLYFMEAAAIITLISLGHWFETRTSAKAEGALRALMNLAPMTARRRNADGSESETPVADLRAGDTVVLKPGDQVPADGVTLEGASTVDESMLTGESLPVEKSPGDKIYAGTLNVNGSVLARVTAAGEGTALAAIIATVERAQNSRAEIQRLGDRVSSVFVPIVVMIALGTGLWWGFGGQTARDTSEWLSRFLWPAVVPAGALAAAFIQAAAVLIIACPCAMGLATPAAIMAGTNAAARRGILVRDGVALERAGKITALVFDKTGTLTQGKPVVAASEVFPDDDTDAKAYPGISCEHLSSPSPREERAGRGAGLDANLDDKISPLPNPLPTPSSWGEGTGAAGSSFNAPGTGDALAEHAIKLASALARRSNHPLSQAVGKLHAEDFEFTDWQEIRGAGVQAKVGSGETMRLGSVRWLQESNVAFTAAAAFEEKWSAQGATLLGIASEKKLLGMLAVMDSLKPGVADVVAELQRAGLKVFLVTGDNAKTAQAIGRQAGIVTENIFAEVRPEAKAGFIQDLQKRGDRVAFVGDGINDAPALKTADLGIAVSQASDVAREAADMILLKSDIAAVPEALGLARATLRTIKQNLFWAFFYNAAGIPLAALGFMSPVLCALAMGVSDLVVIGNALRLLRWRSGIGGRVGGQGIRGDGIGQSGGK